jgi:hypothetical protein
MTAVLAVLLLAWLILRSLRHPASWPVGAAFVLVLLGAAAVGALS